VSIPASASNPGTIHSTTVMPNAISTFRCPVDIGPSLDSSSRTTWVLPAVSVTPRTPVK
jgi:hypothetical protein